MLITNLQPEYLNNHKYILRAGGDDMTHKQQQPQNSKGKPKKEKEQDIKNAEYLAKMNQPNHPNT